MDALCISKNGIDVLAAELIASAGVSFSLNWFGNADKGMAIHVTRTDEAGRQERWKELQVMVGDKVSFVTREAGLADEPIEIFTDEDLVNLAKTKPKMKPGKRVKTPLREIGVLDCRINDKPLFSFFPTTDNMLSIQFVWLGNRTGVAMLHVGSEVSPPPLIPEIAFGDEMAVHWRSPDQKHKPG